jgi:hypothetical protein
MNYSNYYFLKVCLQGQCVSSALAQITDCPAGENLISRADFGFLPSQEMTCSAFFVWASTQPYSIEVFCMTNSSLSRKCCQICKSSFYCYFFFFRKIIYKIIIQSIKSLPVLISFSIVQLSQGFVNQVL